MTLEKKDDLNHRTLEFSMGEIKHTSTVERWSKLQIITCETLSPFSGSKNKLFNFYSGNKISGG